MLFDSVIDAVGHTPLVRLSLEAPQGVAVYAKLEMQNLFGMKDRVARSIVSHARRVGALRDGDPIVESSSGTMALGVAMVGRSLGHPVHIVTDPRIDPITLAKLRALGCEVHVVETMSGQGWQSARLERLARIMEELPRAFWPQQYSNPDNPGAYRFLADELLADLGSVDVLVGSVGSGGSLCGTARALRAAGSGLQVVGVDCVGSVLFGQPDVPQRLQSGLGNSLLPNNLDRRIIDEIHWLNDHEAFASTRMLAAEQRIFAGNTSGSVYRVLADVAARARPGSTIVGIFPDRGDRYTDTVYSEDHWRAHGFDGTGLPEVPDVVDYGTVVHRWSRAVVNVPPETLRHLLFVESNTTGTGMLALDRARDLGLVPVLLTSSPERYQGLDAGRCEVVVADTGSIPALRQTVQQRFRREELAGVTTTSEFFVPMAAELATWLGLPGNPVEAMVTCRNKALLREALAEAGVRQPEFRVVTGADQVAAAVEAVGLPCVVKPVDDSGSNNVLLCSGLAQAQEQVRSILATTLNVRGQRTAHAVLLERYLDAAEFSVEMFSVDGQAHCVGITAKTVSGDPYFVERGHMFPAELAQRDADEIADAVRRALAAVGVRLGATHTEVKLTAEGPAIVEINPRLAGGMIPELIRLATGVDLLGQQLRAAAGMALDLEPRSAFTAGIEFLVAERPGELVAVDGTAAAAKVEGVEQVVVTASPGASVRPPRNAYDRLGYIIARGASHGQTMRALTAAIQECRVVVEQTAASSPQGA